MNNYILLQIKEKNCIDKLKPKLSAGAVEYTDCFSAEG